MSYGYTGDTFNKPPKIFTGTVYDIYPSEGTIDIKVAFPDNRFYEKVPYASTFKDRGLAGFDFVPTRGCTVLLLEHASQDSSGSTAVPLVLGFMAPPGKSIGARTELLPSDVQVQGKYGNNLLLRSNGDAYLVGDERNLIAFLTTEQLTKLRTTNYVHEHAGGRFRWMVDGEQTGGAVAYLYGVKRNASDTAPYLSVAAGTDAGGGLDIRMASQGGEQVGIANPAFINEVPLGCAFRVSVDMAGNTEMSATGNVSAEALGLVNITSAAGINIAAPQISFTSVLGGISIVSQPGAPTKLILPEGLEIVTPQLAISQGVDSLVSSSTAEGHSKRVVTEDLIEWLLNHRHIVPSASSGLSALAGSASSVPITSPSAVTDAVTTAIRPQIETEASTGSPAAIATAAVITQTETMYSISSESVLTKETKVR